MSKLQRWLDVSLKKKGRDYKFAVVRADHSECFKTIIEIELLKEIKKRAEIGDFDEN